MRRLTRSGIRTRLSGLLRVRKSREHHGEPGMRSVGRCLLLATTPLAVLLLTAAAAPADPAGTIAAGAKRTSKTVGPSAGAGSQRVTTQPARPGLMTGWPFAPATTSPTAPAKAVGSIKQRNAPRPTVAAPAPTPAPVQRLALPEIPAPTSNQPAAEPSPAAVATPTPAPTPTPTPTLNPPPTIEPEIAGTAEVEPPPREHATLHGDDAMTVFVPPVMPGATLAPIPEAMPAPVTGTTPEAKPAPVPEAKPTTLPEPKPALTQEAKPAPVPEAKPVTTPEAKPAPTQEAKPAPVPEAKPATTQAAKPVTIPEAKPATVQEAKPATMPDATPSPTPEAMPAPTAVVDVDPIAEQLRNLANGKFDRIIGNKKERASIEAFYTGRNYAPLWITDGNVNARATAAIAYLSQVGADGLDPADYPVPNFTSLSDPAALAEAEIRLTTSVITYAHHAQIGRIHWSRVSADIFYDTKAPDPAAVLASMVEAKDVGEALAAYEPHAPEYLALKAKLAEIRAGRGSSGKARIPNGPSLNIGVQDQRVPLLRLRLGIPGGAGAIYDRLLAEAVMRFQQEHALSVTGTLNAATVEALNGGRQSDARTDIILANMERWRWMPHNLGKTYVIVNLPDYTLRVMRQGKQVWIAKIVAGKTTTPTPLISAQMKSITVNPIWNVPASITANEYLPLLQQDPTILQRMGLIVSYNPDGTIHIAQPPGDQNALGRLRFNFPNKFMVYQHDSNQKSLFANERRAESHGCMRVQDPLKYAEVLLSLVRPADGFTQDRIHALFGDNEVEIPFPALLPVHVTYQTAFVDDRGQLEFREDVYGHDEALLAMMKGAERKVADIPIERRESMARRQLLAMPDNALNGWGANGRGFGETNIFTRLFGNPYAQPAPVPRSPIAQPRQQPYYQR
jgi:murein L,D-transpeptidase YcbB/YkuD